MCEPLMLIGGALAAASAGMNYAAQQEQEAAREDVLAAEQIRQQGLDREAAAVNAESQNRYQGFDKKQDKKAKTLGEYFSERNGGRARGASPNSSAGSRMPSASSDVVNREIAKQEGESDAFVGQQGEALGDLRSFGELLGGINRLQARDGSLIGQLAGFKTGSANVVPLELDEANQEGAGLRLFADLLSGAGAVVGSGGFGQNPASLFKIAAPTVAGAASRAAPGSFRAAQEAGFNGASLYGQGGLY